MRVVGQTVAALLVDFQQVDVAKSRTTTHSPMLVALDQADAMQIAEIALQQIVGQERLGGHQRFAVQAAAFAVRGGEMREHAQQAREFLAARRR